MEEGTKTKKTIFVGGISDDTDETTLYEGFSTFGAHIPYLLSLLAMKPLLNTEFLNLTGDILEVQIPPPASQHQNPAPDGSSLLPFLPVSQTPDYVSKPQTAPKHRGFAFITFSSQADAQDAIDNMDLNELKGKVLRVNLARPMKAAMLNPQGNRASAFHFLILGWVWD